MSSRKVFCLDTETTAGMIKWRVVQFAIVDREGFAREWLIKPPTVIEIGTQAVHHITPRMVESAPSFSDSPWFTELSRRLKEGEILVAHYAPFDVRILKNEWVIIPEYIDTCRVARHILNAEGISSFSLQYLRYALKLDEDHPEELTTGYAHSALYDSLVLSWLFEALYSRIEFLSPLKDPIEIMLSLTKQPIAIISKIRFGKYRGKTIAEVAEKDINYLKWLYREQTNAPIEDQNIDLIESLQKYI